MKRESDEVEPERFFEGVELVALDRAENTPGLLQWGWTSLASSISRSQPNI